MADPSGVPPGVKASVRAAAPPEAPGLEPARYRVVEEIARGGMGAILRAEDGDLCRDVAMKVMLDSARGAEQRQRFLLEARVTGLLEHPNIVPVHQLGQDPQGRPFFTMKLVRGRSLARVLHDLRKSPVGPWNRRQLYELLNVFIGTCNAVAFAHSKRILHRDLKPDNVMVGDFGEVLVMDWGIAKLLDAEEERCRTRPDLAAITDVAGGAIAPEQEAPAPRQSTSPSGHRPDPSIERLREHVSPNLTSADVVLGTPHYLPPEHALGRHAEVDERADVYALGAILYEILTLRRPVEGDSAFAVLAKVVEGTVVPPVARAPKRKIAPELSAVAMKALAKRAAERYPTVEALRRDVELFLHGGAGSAKLARGLVWLVTVLRRTGGAGVARAVAVALLSLLGVVSWRAQRVEQTRTRAALDALRDAQRQSAPELARAAQRALTAGEPDAALSVVDTALRYDPLLTEARRLRAQVLLLEDRVAEADVDLSLHLAMHPDDKPAVELLRVCRRARTEPVAALRPALADALDEMGSGTLARRLRERAGLGTNE